MGSELFDDSLAMPLWQMQPKRRNRTPAITALQNFDSSSARPAQGAANNPRRSAVRCTNNAAREMHVRVAKPRHRRCGRVQEKNSSSWKILFSGQKRPASFHNLRITETNPARDST
jgi:hypothetical protein